jgi:hypothetical protein
MFGMGEYRTHVRERRIFSQMAETWLEVAVLAEKREKRQAKADKRPVSPARSL